MKHVEETLQASIQAYNEYTDIKEGVDYVQLPTGVENPNMPNEKKLEKALRREINILKLTDPASAKEYEE